jgi:hypothetical protein
MLDSALVSACSHGGISERSEFVVIRLEHTPGFSCWLFEYDDHEAAHQESSVGLLGVVETCVVINFVGAVLLVANQFLQFLAEKVNFTQIKGTKVCEEWLVHEIIVNAEIESMRSGLGWVFI